MSPDCQPSAPLLPTCCPLTHCQPVAPLLPTCCPFTANLLPPYCHPATDLLLICYPSTANLLPPSWPLRCQQPWEDEFRAQIDWKSLLRDNERTRGSSVTALLLGPDTLSGLELALRERNWFTAGTLQTEGDEQSVRMF
jgi:hypothetical protein